MNNIDFAKQVSLSVYMQQTDTHRFNWCVVLELFVLPQYLRIKQLRFWLKKKNYYDSELVPCFSWFIPYHYCHFPLILSLTYIFHFVHVFTLDHLYLFLIQSYFINFEIFSLISQLIKVQSLAILLLLCHA